MGVPSSSSAGDRSSKSGTAGDSASVSSTGTATDGGLTTTGSNLNATSATLMSLPGSTTTPTSSSSGDIIPLSSETVSSSPTYPADGSISSSSSSSPTPSTATDVSFVHAEYDYDTLGVLAGGIVGAFLAAAITFLCMRRSGSKREPEPVMDRRARRHSRSAGVNNGHARDEKLPILVDIHAWERYLPQGLDDRTVQTAVKTLFDQIQLHVENFYTTADVEIT
ncbi:hypothetical protein B0A55_11141, partial [Friedmanniomyces simplex]